MICIVGWLNKKNAQRVCEPLMASNMMHDEHSTCYRKYSVGHTFPTKILLGRTKYILDVACLAHNIGSLRTKRQPKRDVR